MANRYDIAIIGGGMVGATAGVLLSRAGFRVVVIEAREPGVFDPHSDVGLRVSALSAGTRNILEQANAWPLIEAERHCPIQTMTIQEATTDEAITFRASDFAAESLGTIVENDLVQSALWRSLKGGLAEVRCPVGVAGVTQDDAGATLTLDNGDVLEAELVVAADGGRSAIRAMTDIQVERWDYQQRAIVAVLETERKNEGCAWQRFLNTGPLAFLPLADGRSSMVWSLPAVDAQRLKEVTADELVIALNKVADSPFGQVTAAGATGQFPLSMQLSERYIAGRIILLGDAAHVVHPLAGQGVNLGMLDAAALVECLLKSRKAGKHLAEPRTLRQFERWRISDNAVMARGIDGIQQAFQARLPIWPLLRQAGGRAVGNSWVIRSGLLNRASGMHSDAPAIARGLSLMEIS